MPVPMLKGMAKKGHRSTQTAERYWKEAKEAARRKGIPAGTPRFYRYTAGIVKRRLGLSSEHSNMTNDETAKVNRWSGKVTKAVKKGQHTKPGIFTKPGTKIAKYLHARAGTGRAIRKLTFYMNRAGKNLSEADRKKLDTAKRKLERLHHATAALIELANSKTAYSKGHPHRTPEEMQDHIEHTKRHNGLPFNEDNHRRHKKEEAMTYPGSAAEISEGDLPAEANVDDREYDHTPGFTDSNPDTDPMWGNSWTSSVEQEWQADDAALERHHHQREAVGHGGDLREAWKKAMHHQREAHQASSSQERIKHQQLADRYLGYARIQAQKVKKHIQEGR